MLQRTRPGPWDQEPKEREWTDDATGYQCLIVKTDLGHLCGYVRVPKTHPFHGKNYDARVVANRGQVTIDPDRAGVIPLFIEAMKEDDGRCSLDVLLDVHGGVTFAGEIKDKPGWWFGFDCAHAGDLTPMSLFPDGTYKDGRYVRQEVERLAKQLKEWEVSA